METHPSSQRVTSLYGENFRPDFHFTPERNWMNDPNGLLFYKGKYHLFYQHNPEGILWGNMSWGHATSTDLLQWEHHPVAISFDQDFGIFSGSAVVDYTNSTGFGSLDNPPMVAIYTAHRHDGSHQSQHLAYSLDDGLTWVKYEGNPVLDLGMKDFRDPKVSWDPTTNTWLMTVSKPNDFTIAFFRSDDLKKWEHLSDFGPLGATGGCWECPDLFSLTSPTGAKKWVLIVSLNPGGVTGGSGTQYFIGDWDGTSFTTSQDKTLWIDYGRDNYAGVTFNNLDNDNRIFIGWMSNWEYGLKIPTPIWRSSMTAPRQLELLEVSGELLLTANPIKEIPSKYRQEITCSADESFNIEITNNEKKVIVTFDATSKKISINRSGAWFDGIDDAPQISPAISPKEFKTVIVLDNGSLELFIPEAGLSMTSLTSLSTAGATLQKTAKRLP